MVLQSSGGKLINYSDANDIANFDSGHMFFTFLLNSLFIHFILVASKLLGFMLKF